GKGGGDRTPISRVQPVANVREQDIEWTFASRPQISSRDPACPVRSAHFHIPRGLQRPQFLINTNNWRALCPLLVGHAHLPSALAQSVCVAVSASQACRGTVWPMPASFRAVSA